MKTVKYVLVLALASLLIAGTSGVSSALDYKHLPASACEWASDYDGFPLTNPPGYVMQPEYTVGADGRITTGSSLWNNYVVVSCPIIRDKTNDTNASLFLRIDVLDRNSTAGVFCSLSTAAPNGSSGMVVTASSGVTFSGGFKEISMLGMTTSVNEGVYGFSCLIPRNAEMLGYFWREGSDSETT